MQIVIMYYTKLTPFAVTNGEWEDTSKSMKNECIVVCQKGSLRPKQRQTAKNQTRSLNIASYACVNCLEASVTSSVDINFLKKIFLI